MLLPPNARTLIVFVFVIAVFGWRLAAAAAAALDGCEGFGACGFVRLRWTAAPLDADYGYRVAVAWLRLPRALVFYSTVYMMRVHIIYLCATQSQRAAGVHARSAGGAPIIGTNH